MDQKSIQKSMGKIIDFSMVLEGSWGVSPCRGHLRGWIARPPKSRFFKTDQTPLELGKGKGNGLG